MSLARADWIQLLIPDPAPFGKGCPAGSVAALFPAFPYLGAPVSCSGDGAVAGPNGPAPITPLLYQWCGPCGVRTHVAAPNGTNPEFATPALTQPTDMLQRWRMETRPDIPGTSGGPW